MSTPSPADIRPRVFVVDDEKAVADTLAVVLRSEGFDVTPFYDGLPALEAAVANPPDMVVTDVVMPGLDGLGLASMLKEHCPGTRVILISGQAHMLNIVAKSYGDHVPQLTLLEKPIHPSELIAQVKGALAATA